MSQSLHYSETEPTLTSNVRIGVLGGLRLESPDGDLEAFGSRHAATILAILALHHEPVSRARLGAELWPGEDEEVVRPRLRQELFRLKKSLGPWSSIVSADREFVSLRRPGVGTDVEEFLALVQSGRSAEGERRLELWLRAAELYKDDILVDFDGEWINHERSSLQGIRRRLLLTLIQALVDGGRPADAVGQARVLVRLDFSDEAAHAALVQAMHASGDSSAAMDHLRRAEARLRADGRPTGEALARAWRVLETPAPDPGGVREPAAKKAKSKSDLSKALPVPLHPIFGREAELEKILGLIEAEGPDAARLLTVVGFGGMGKTRLALEVAHRLAGRGKRLVGFVWLIEVDSPDVLIQNIAATVCSAREQSQDLYATIASEMEGKEVTLILDNFEELVPSANHVVERLLGENPGLRLLVTSRTPLGLLSEQVFPLSPLAVPGRAESDAETLASPSVALFLDHTRRVRPDFQVDEESLASVVRLVHAVEGIPLAILLAACRMRAISPQEAERAIQDRLSFLTGPRGGFEARHQTMRACIAWTGDELPAEVKEFWKKLAIFHGGWSLSAAQTVLGERNALDYLEILCDSSLVHRQQNAGPARYAMFEPVRQFADELFEPADRERAAERHAEFFVEFVELATATGQGVRPGRGFDEIEIELDNVRAALAWGVEHNPSFALRLGIVLRIFWSDGGWHVEGRRWLDSILALPEAPGQSRERMLINLSAGIMGMDQADFGRAREHYLAALAIAKVIEDEHGAGWIELNLAHLDVLAGLIEKALPIQESALAAFEQEKHETGIAHTSTALGLSLLRVNQRQRALDLMERALSIRLEIGWPNGVAFAEAGLGSGLLMLGHAVQAYEHLDAAYEICHRLRDANRILLDILMDSADCCLELERLDLAASRLFELRELCRRIGDKLGTTNCDIRAAAFELAHGRPLESVAFARKALDSALQLGMPITVLESLRAFASIGIRLGMNDVGLSLALGIERVGDQMGVSSWPSRDHKQATMISVAGESLHPQVRERIRAQSRHATIQSLRAEAEKIEAGAGKG